MGHLQVQWCSEVYAGLHGGHELGGAAELRGLAVGERLADHVGHATLTDHARQWQEHLLLDTVLALLKKRKVKI